MPWHDGLTGGALEIAQTTNSPLRVMAGPGTGKSYAMKRRLMRLLEEGISPERILVVTFTRTAAAALVDDINALNTEGCEHIVASTLHSYCYGLLKRRYIFSYTKRTARPLVVTTDRGILKFEASPLLQDLKQEPFGDKRERIKRIRAYEADWARQQSDKPGRPTDPIDIQFRETLIRWLVFHEAMLVGELVPLALSYLRNHADCGERNAFDHVLVDEYQDLNKAEQVLLDYLAENGKLAIFGDEDQSIYSFRWAHPEGIVDFHLERQGTFDSNLKECQRCPKRVVAMADALIRHNHHAGHPARLHPKPTSSQGEVHVVQWPHIGDESSGIAQYVNHLVNKQQRYEPKDILILSPRRLIGYGIKDALRGAGIPTHSFYHEEALDEDKAMAAFALLTLLANRNDRVALRYWLGDGSDTWNARGYFEVRTHCEKSGESPWDVMDSLRISKLKLPHSKSLVKRFEELLAQIAVLEPLKPMDMVDALFPEGESWAQELRDLSLTGQKDDEEGPTPAALLERLRRGITQPELPSDGDFAKVMSLHKSKGLTSKVVIVTGCMLGLIPNIKKEGTIEEIRAYEQEQRRLFYVAITRGREVLVMSSVSFLERKLAHHLGVEVYGGKGQFAGVIASTFFDELGPQKPESQKGDNFIKNLPSGGA